MEGVNVSPHDQAVSPATDNEEPASRPSSRRIRVRRYLAISPLAALLIAWLYLFSAKSPCAAGPRGASCGTDYAMFMSAAHVVERGGNPYDQAQVYTTERGMLRAAGLPLEMPGRSLIRVGNPPLFFWL